MAWIAEKPDQLGGEPRWARFIKQKRLMPVTMGELGLLGSQVDRYRERQRMDKEPRKCCWIQCCTSKLVVKAPLQLSAVHATRCSRGASKTSLCWGETAGAQCAGLVTTGMHLPSIGNPGIADRPTAHPLSPSSSSENFNLSHLLIRSVVCSIRLEPAVVFWWPQQLTHSLRHLSDSVPQSVSPSLIYYTSKRRLVIEHPIGQGVQFQTQLLSPPHLQIPQPNR